MRKWIGAGIILLVVIVLTIPYGIGWWVQWQYRTWIKKNTVNPSFTIQSDTFHRGWFYSKARLDIIVVEPGVKQLWKLMFPEHANIPLILTFHESIQHGPFLVKQYQINVSPEMAHALGLTDIPEWNVSIDQRARTDGFWLGDISITSPFLMINNADDKPFLTFEHYQICLHTDEYRGQWSVIQEFNTKHLIIGTEETGPLYLHWSLKGINLSDTLKMIAEGKRILLQGELYQSQFRVKMSMMLSQLMTSHSLLRIDQLKWMTPKGNLLLKGDVYWEDAFNSATNVVDLVRSASLKVEARVSKALLKEIMHWISRAPYLYDIPADVRMAVLQQDEDIDKTIKRNVLLMTTLVQDRQLSEAAAEDFLAMQNDNISQEQYFRAIQQSLLKKEMTLAVSYSLAVQYIGLRNQIDELNKAVENIQNNTEKKMQTQWEAWVKGGFVAQDGNDYVISLTRTQGNFFLNGKMVVRRK